VYERATDLSWARCLSADLLEAAGKNHSAVFGDVGVAAMLDVRLFRLRGLGTGTLALTMQLFGSFGLPRRCSRCPSC